MRFHHVGIAVRRIVAAASWWTEVCRFREASPIIHDPLQRVRVQFFENADGFRVELVEPAAEPSPVDRYLEGPTGGLNHICYEVEDLDETVVEWRNARAFPVTKPLPAVAFNGRRIVFMLTPHKQLVEFIDSENRAL